MKNFLFALLLLTAFTNCKKDDDNKPAPAKEQPKVTGFTFNTPNLSEETITYDAEGRVTKYEDAYERTTMSYNGNTVTISTWYIEQQKQVYLATGKLNGQGRLTEVAGTVAYTLPEKTFKTTFQYNGAGQLTKQFTSYNNGESTTEYRYFYQNGNMTSREVYTDGELNYTGVWEYDNTPADPTGLGWYRFVCGSTIAGAANKNLPSRYATVRNGVEEWYLNHTYTTDADGLVKTCTNLYSNGNTFVVTYKYE